MRKQIALFLAGALGASALAGCSGNGKTEEPGKTAGQPSAAASVAAGAVDDGKEKLTITFLPESWSGGKWREDHPTIKYLNEKFNIDLKLMWTDGPTYKDKLNVMAASNSLPDMYRVTSDNFGKWQNEGIFMDLAPHLSKYPNLAKAFPEDQWKMLNPQGKTYGIPLWEIEIRDSYQIRADWIRNVGLPMPKEETFNLDEFYQLMKAFALNDPDKNGKKDTVGFTTDNELGVNTAQLRAAFGLANGWKLVDGKLIPQQVQAKEQKDFLGYLRKMYEEGIMDKDFLSKKGQNVYELMQSGKSGIYTHHPSAMLADNEKLKKIDPNAELVQLAPPIGPTGLRGNGTGLNGANKVVVNGKIDPKKQERILKILDWWVTDEGTDIMKSGIEGPHYTKVADGKYTSTPLIDTDLPRILNNWFFKRADPNMNIFRWTDPEVAEFIDSFNKNNAKYPWKNDSGGLEIYSETHAKLWKDLDTKFKETQLKIVVGQEPLDSIDKAIAAWKANGGDKIIQEMNDAYAKYNGK
ncbi:extracellular solute-binding protein [Paenibacillus sp. YN15]|uniref:extracellular solute-binding protein n=1 Tax=Paenibacillus sp. YN15 TaxID=1742774 RepID=UPI000DCE4898|nr:extracellular solute-binding protein [Paenibacillus sp. YN15]RAV04985.1 ABC transporter substrate-binding protein [Paenibacillus sp. YN15]